MNQAASTARAPATGRTHFVALDGLRGLAALTVFAYHMTRAYFAPSPIDHGYLAVDIFFVLSGFVVASAYERRMNSDKHPLLFFAEVRFVRLYPMIVLGALAGALMSLVGVTHVSNWVKVLVEQLLFIPSIHSGYAVYPLNIVQWSVAWEIAANIAHVLILRRLGIPALSAVAVLAAIALAYVALKAGHIDQGATIRSAVGGAPRVAFSYVMGVILSRLSVTRRIGVFSWLWPMPFIAFALTVCSLAPRGSVGGALQDIISVLVVFPLAVWTCAHSHLPRPAAVLANVAGRASYPLYAIQGAVLSLLGLLGTAPSASRYAWSILLFMLTATAAWMIDRFVDNPIQRLRKAVRDGSWKAQRRSDRVTQ